MSSLFRVYRTPKLSDRQVLDLRSALPDTIEQSSTFQLLHNYGLTPELEQQILSDENSSFNIHTCDITLRKGVASVYFRRGICKLEHAPLGEREPSPYFDEIIVQKSTHLPQGTTDFSSEEFVEILSSLQRYAGPLDAIKIEGQGSATNVLAAQISSITRLHEKMIADAQFFRTELEKERNVIEANAKTLVQEKARELESDYDTQLKSLDAEKQALEERKKEIDDRAYTFARRADRSRITEAIKQRLQLPGLSKSTLRQRWIVFWLLLIGIAGAIAGAVATALELNALTLPELNPPAGSIDSASAYREDKIFAPTALYWVTLGRLALFSATGFALLLATIQWAKRIYTEDSRAERNLEKFSFDLDRASWTIETILEAKKESGITPPHEWIEGACKNLFVMPGDTSNQKEDSSMDAFADLLKVAAEAKVGTDGASLTFNNRGTKKIAKSVED